MHVHILTDKAYETDAVDAIAEIHNAQLKLSFACYTNPDERLDALSKIEPSDSGLILYNITDWYSAGLRQLNILSGNGVPIIEVHPKNIFCESGSPLPKLNGNKVGLICGFQSRGLLTAIARLNNTKLSTTSVKTKRKVRIINGPNLNLVGQREPEIYGFDTLEDVEKSCVNIARSTDQSLEFFQSNYEGQILDWIQDSIGKIDAIILNAGALTHTSIAIHDALKAFPGKTIELHISNPHQREVFRHQSFVSLAADAVITGLGVKGYELALLSQI